MAYVNITRSLEAGILDRVTAAFKTANERYAQYQAYRKTLNELSSLSGRDLADLGIHRSMIKSIAMEAAYGK